jgi:hypothetical protein
MASTISGINVALVDQKIHEALKQVLPMLKAFSYVIEQDDRIQNDTVQVPLATDPSVGTKTAGTFVAADGALSSATVTYNKFRAAGWDATESLMRGSLLAQYWADKAAGAVYGVAKDIIDTALALVTKANYNDGDGDKLVVAPADFGQDDAALLWSKATTKIKRQAKVFMMNTPYAAQLFGNSNLALIYASAGNNFLQSGQLPQFLDLNQMHYADMPANSENLGGAIFGRAAIAVGIARPGFFLQSGEGDIVERRIITEPDSGLSAMYTVKASAGGTISGEVAALFGVAKAQDAVVRLVSA